MFKKKKKKTLDIGINSVIINIVLPLEFTQSFIIIFSGLKQN